jgi:endonuclease YncB( thermonuclease family)
MIKRIFVVLILLFSITLLIGCQEEESTNIVLPNLTGMNKTEALNALSGLKISIVFDDVINNDLTEGVFSNYGNNLVAGMVVEPQTEITVYFVIHENLNGVRLPDLTGLDREGVLDLLFEENISLIFLDLPTNDIEEGLFVDYSNNYQAGMVIPFETVLTIYFAIEEVFINDGLIISTYVEGTGNNKAIEIANRSGEAIDLSEYRISLYSNGSETITTSIPLTGNLGPQEVFVIAHPLSSPEILLSADMTTAELNFDGNDAVAVTFRNGAVVDIIGVIGWGFYYIENETFVRKQTITKNSQTFDQTDWDIYAIDNFSMLGSHPTVFPQSFTYNAENLALSFDQKGGMVLVEYDFANDGDTSTFLSLDPNFSDFVGGARVRFIGIDTPEVSGTPDSPQPFAIAAKDYLTSLLENATEIYLMHDPASGASETYGRTLALVWADGLLVNVEMVRMGFSAAVYSDDQQQLIFNGVSLNRWFERAEQEAKAQKRGIWSN